MRSEGSAENARPENDGQRKLWVWKMQEWKMTDKLLANCKYIFQMKYTEAILSKSTRKVLWFEIIKILIAVTKINSLCRLL